MIVSRDDPVWPLEMAESEVRLIVIRVVLPSTLFVQML